MLEFNEKKAVFDSFSELTKSEVSLGRLNYRFTDSAIEKTTVVKYLHPKSSNAWVYAGYLPDAETKDGYLSVRNLTEEEIRELVTAAIAFLKKTKDGYENGYRELWCDQAGILLELEYNQGVWTVLTEDIVEAVFTTKDAAVSYLKQEGFEQKNS